MSIKHSKNFKLRQDIAKKLMIIIVIYDFSEWEYVRKNLVQQMEQVNIANRNKTNLLWNFRKFSVQRKSGQNYFHTEPFF